MNTDPFPTPRGALSPDGVSAATPNLDAMRAAERAVRLGVPGYAGAKGAIPEPQGPTTAAGRRLAADLWWLRGSGTDADFIGLIGAIEAEARAAARPNIDVDQVLRYLRSSRTRRDLAEAIGGETARDNEVYLRMATNILAKLQARRLASPDATHREPSGE